jgi:predicted ATPase
MKIKELSLRNYKRFVNPKPINFCDEDGNPNEMTLIVGDNGSGKSSVLQAIAMLVGGVVKPHFTPSELDYPGFNYEYIQTGPMPVDVRATMQFAQDEIQATQEFSHEVRRRFPSRQGGERYIAPGNHREIELHLDYRGNRIESTTAPKLFQTKGYQYALQLRPFFPNPSELLSRVGSIFWYTEHRTSSSINFPFSSNGNGEEESLVPKKMDESLLRGVLVKWYRFHDNVQSGRFELREGQRDIYAELRRTYHEVFRPRDLLAPAPRMAPEQILEEEDFWISEGNNNQYEISGMSGGERAIFPILVDFANWHIHNSIVLIDEIELHLHPPLQQAIIRALPRLGNNNQFIITTHSDYVAAMFSEEQIIRLNDE